MVRADSARVWARRVTLRGGDVCGTCSWKRLRGLRSWTACAATYPSPSRFLMSKEAEEDEEDEEQKQQEEAQKAARRMP
jgi:hypothetical protein